ncbi:class I SAM-dependent methyltransferase [Pedobacter ginsengiterrae]|uniref:S-adenosyl-L-methionine-dependent methyltransferase n=1 Tax=Pedobacter ginsengiterrae TaxID=871696 RepID=A0ABP7P301_9SPHI
MKKNQSSKTAEGVALIRAIESEKPVNIRICYDPFARAFIPKISYFLSKLFINSGIYNRVAQGLIELLIVRDRYIDDCLKGFIREGVDQIVILGAGFDTRGYRIDGIEKIKIFEVDHPDTLKIKLKRLKKVIKKEQQNIFHVPVDFNTQSLAERLLESGYNDQLKTFFIWQGVTVYLTNEGVDNTLSFIANRSGEGSSIIFDFFDNEMLQDTNRPEVKMMHRSAKVTGEGFLFGIDSGTIEVFLSKRGFQDVENKTAKMLTEIYLTGQNAHHSIPEGFNIVLARVKERNFNQG